MSRLRLELGKIYQTLGAGTVTIIEKKITGRKIFTGQLQDGTLIQYFRNGRFSNASQRKGGHRFDIVIKPVEVYQ
jgi:hypothetical protein